MTTILVVDDDPSIRSVVSRGLRFEGYEVQVAADGLEALRIAREQTLHMIVLDVMLPNLDGLEVCQRLRRGTNVPIIMLTARDAIPDRIAGLDSGADDYLVKPFDLSELVARIRALLRRAHGRSTDTIRHLDIVLTPASLVVTRGEETVSLSGRECAILVELLEHRGMALSRARLEESLYGWGEEIESNAVEVHIHNLRRKLGADLIRTIRGVGYMIRKEAP